MAICRSGLSVKNSSVSHCHGCTSGTAFKSQENITRYGLEDYIEIRLSDGLAKLEPGEGDTLVIAGMGGPLMERILKDGAKVREGFQELILQPQSDLPHFRHFLSEIGWEIVREEMIKEDGKFYPMMKAVRNNSGKRLFTQRKRPGLDRSFWKNVTRSLKSIFSERK